jgi:hypothetical protein
VFTIGELQWDDPFGFGPELTLLNYADSPQFPSEPIPSDFVGGAFTDLTWDFSFADAGSAQFFGTPPDQVDPGSLAGFGTDPLTQLTLSFSFSYSLAGAALFQTYSLVASQPAFDDLGEQHESRLIDFSLTTEPVSVPEPETSLLLMTGVALVVGGARRRTA